MPKQDKVFFPHLKFEVQKKVNVASRLTVYSSIEMGQELDVVLYLDTGLLGPFELSILWLQL